MNEKEDKLNLKQASLPVISLAVLIILSVVFWDIPIHIPIIFQLTFTIGLGLYWGFEWSEIEKMLFSGFNNIGSILFILLLIGILIGIWINIGVVPSMIYYGMLFMEPEYFLLLAFLFSTFVSLAIGTAFGTVSTIGLALISIAHGMGLSLELVAGSIISGAYIGDRMSPVSSISIMTAYSANTKHTKMIKHMIYTIIPPFFVSGIIYYLIGKFKMVDPAISTEVLELMAVLSQNYSIGLVYFIPPLLIILLATLRTPTLLTLLVNIIFSLIMGLVLSGSQWIGLMEDIYYGHEANTGLNILNEILSRGGIISMLELISLIILAVMLGSLFDNLGILHGILGKLILLIKKEGDLVVITALSSIISAMLGCNQLFAVYLPGKMLEDKYDELEIDKKILGRTLGDSGLIVSPLIPWNVNALMMVGILGVPTLSYLPFSFVPLMLPFVTVLFAYIPQKFSLDFARNFISI